ncbi:alcohol dehydrogenase catalytic domain-containing protein [candidate division KSB1 bacterium]|nr:alcohol dehydrogenase catalytic domain-containing protein [candidate division KSB1 bacterium]MBL7095128.1 alcohol dehydrogenase catalytic domain-containing protein [candidate division KSB1 bacterium]
MKAVVLTEPKVLQLADIPEFKLTEENHVLVKVKACGICGSDLRYWAGDNPWSLHTLGKHVSSPPNMVMGHEFAGEVVKVNSKENEHFLGKRVGVQSYRVCGKCRFCKTGRENLCRNMIHIGHAQGWGEMDYYPGAYAEYCIGWADLLHPIPDHITYAQAAMADILCVAVHVVGRTRIYEGAHILCIGGGPAGLSIAQVTKVLGAEKIILSDPSPIARQVIGQFNTFTVVDPGEDNIADQIKDTVGDQKFAAIFDSVGSLETINMALPLLEESGTYVNLVVHGASINFDMRALGSERTITTSSNAYYRDLTKAFELLNSGIVDVKPWITHRFRLEDFQKAFELLTKSPKEAYKVVFEPWG